MRTIYKYQLNLIVSQYYDLPVQAEPLSVGIDPQGQLCLWALIDIDAGLESRIIRIIETGNPISYDQGTFIGTVKQDQFIWHIFVD